jgi:anti-sigma factor RsiW
MRSDVDLQTLNAFVDGELDLTRQLDMEDRLRGDPALRDDVEGLRLLRETLRDGADYHVAPSALRAHLAAASAPPVPVQARRPGRSAWLATWLWARVDWRPLVVSTGLVASVALAFNLAWLHATQDDRLRDEVVASHVRSTLGQHLIDVASSDHHTVKPWLSAKLDFSPPVAELALPESTLLGGRVDYLDGRPVAALVYRQGAHVVNSFVWPSAAQDSAPVFTVERGFQTAHWTRSGMTHWLISDLNREEFAGIVLAIQRADDAR